MLVLSSTPTYEEYSNYKDVIIKYKIVSGKNISAIRFKWFGTNAFGESANNATGAGMTDNLLKTGASPTSEWSLYNSDLKKLQPMLTKLFYKMGQSGS